MKNWLINKALAYAGRKMDGKKTYAGAGLKMITGVTLVLGGVAGLVGTMYPDLGAPAMDWETASATIASGIYAFSSGLEGAGIGHKLEKQNAGQ